MSKAKSDMTRIVLKGVRISYCNLWTPREVTDENGNVSKDSKGNSLVKYSCQLLIPKTGKFAKENEKVLDEAIASAKEKGKSKLVNKNGVVPSSLKVCKRDGDTDPTYEGDPIYANMWVVNTSNMRKPGIIDKNKQTILEEEEVYSGMWAFVSITLAAFDSGKAKGIGAFINNLMKTKDDDRLDGGIAAEKEFEAYDDDDEDDDENI